MVRWRWDGDEMEMEKNRKNGPENVHSYYLFLSSFLIDVTSETPTTNHHPLDTTDININLLLQEVRSSSQ